MGTPYEIDPQVLPPQAAVPVVYEIDWNHRSVISKILVHRLAGAGEFTVELFNYPIENLPMSNNVKTEDKVGRLPEDMFRVTPPITSVGGVDIRYFSDEATGGYGYVFFSQQLLPGPRKQRANKLYVRITPAGGGAHRFAICLGGMLELE